MQFIRIKESYMLNIKSLRIQRLNFKLYLTFLFLILIIIILITSVFSSLYAQSLNKSISADSVSSLDRFSTEFNNIFNQVVNINMLLREDSDVSDYLAKADVSYLSINKSLTFLRQLHYSNQYIHSIFVFSPNNPIVLSSGKTGIDISQFINSELSFVHARDSNLTMVFTSIPSPTANRFSTLSVLFADAMKDQKISDNAIIINLDKDEIEHKLLRQYDGITYIIDNSGSIVFSSFSTLESSTELYDAINRRILASTDYKNSFNIDDNIIAYTRIISSDLTLVNIKSFEKFSKSFENKKLEIQLTALTVFIIFSLLGFLMIRNLYRPLGKITEVIAKSKFNSNKNNYNEISVISRVYNETLEYIKKLELESQNNLINLRQSYIRYLLQTSEICEAKLAEFDAYHFDISFNNVICIKIKISHNVERSTNEKFAVSNTLCTLIPDLLGDNLICEAVEINNYEIALLAAFKDNTQNSFPKLLDELYLLQGKCRENLSIVLTFGIGSVCNSMHDLHEAYLKADKMIKYTFLFGTGQVYYERFIEESIVTNAVYPEEIENNITASIKLNKKKMYILNLNNFVIHTRTCTYSSAVSYCFQIVSSVIKVINDIVAQETNKFSLNFYEFNNIFSSLETIEELKNWLVDIYSEYEIILGQINELKSNKHYSTINKIQEFIDKNYADINLTLESIADAAGYTPYYLSKMFKEITGTNIPDYIRKVRISKSKDLLLNDQVKINDIPALIGFTNLSHYYSVFKKDVGLTPAAYRQFIQSKAAEQ